MLLLTGVMTAFTGLLWWLAKRQTAMIHTIERAYVSLSHFPPGLEFDYGDFVFSSTERPGLHRYITIRVRVQNHGNTPATVTDVSLRPYIGVDLPDTPSYVAGSRESAFLVKDSGFVITRKLTIRAEDAAEVAKGNKRLWIYGYVDYQDRFRRDHRAGYARVYDPSMDAKQPYEDSKGVLDDAAYRGRNNLPFAGKPGYNYDEPHAKKRQDNENRPTGGVRSST